MSDFIPPYPHRHPKSLGPMDTIKYLRKDLLSFWPEKAFSRNFITIKIVSRSIIIANCPDAVAHVLVNNPGNYEKKSGLMRKALTPLLAESLLVSDGEMWQKHSQLIRPFFAAGQLGKFSEVMVKAAAQQRERWGNLPSGSTLPVLPEMKALSAAILCRVLFGGRLNDQQTQQFVASVSHYLATIEDLDINTFFGLPNWIPSFGGNKTTKAAKTVHGCIDKIIANSQADGTSLLGLFLGLPGNAFSREQIRHELLTFFLAGYETTANTLAWAWYLIAQCPEVEQRLHQELDSVLVNGTATIEDVPKLAYTRAIIEETLRLYPPFPMLSREAKANDKFQNHTIPAGSLMLIVPWLLHRHKHYWENPDHFIPERFLESSPVKPTPYTYLPFSFGARECVAKHLGTVQTTLCLAVLAQHNRLQTRPGQTANPICKVMLRPDNDLPMDLIKR
ncbi:MAG: cytochrome P450 [Methylovulum sp.]|uniref:cytochrome P450 n=1 Tax=Methylovulum sp. TaxID=1916980 RepID=UPI00261202A6|nr:cytochrome P450 [Methylovulum sp.]MDD2725591.1 cytochrome P450 [Methylovulum sp.]MDD5125687.1 cytochrome P450 [Methylovulum sp.]